MLFWFMVLERLQPGTARKPRQKKKKSVEAYEATVFPLQTMKWRKLPETKAGNNLQGLVSINLTLPMRRHLLKTPQPSNNTQVRASCSKHKPVGHFNAKA